MKIFEIVLSWFAPGSLSESRERAIAALVARSCGSLRREYRRILQEIYGGGIYLAKGGPRAPALAIKTNVLFLPHLGRKRDVGLDNPTGGMSALVCRELPGGGSSWEWPGSAPRVVPESESVVEIGDEITGLLRIPLFYEERGTEREAYDLAKEAERCAEQARSEPEAATKLGIELADAFETFKEDLERCRAAFEEGLEEEDDDRVVHELLAARAALEKALGEIPENGELATRLAKLDAALAGVGEATFLVGWEDYLDIMIDVAVVPGRWWALHTELEEKMSFFELERLLPRALSALKK